MTHLFKIKALKPTQLGVEIYLSQSSLFVTQNLKRLLPECNNQNPWTILILQQSQLPLINSTLEAQSEKNRLRNQFINLSQIIVKKLNDQGCFSDFFDPMIGYPVLSHRGDITHDDVAVVQALLGYPVIQNHCSALIHPLWKTAVYPGVLMTTAISENIQSIVIQTIQQQGWQIEEASEEVKEIDK